MIREPWARGLTGGSTAVGSAGAPAVPSGLFRRTWVLYPDPVDFRITRFPTSTATRTRSCISAEWMTADVPASRNHRQPRISIRQESSSRRLAAGALRRAVRDLERRTVPWRRTATGRAVELRSGAIDHSVAEYFRAHDYDLRDYLERNWAALGQAQGRIMFHRRHGPST